MNSPADIRLAAILDRDRAAVARAVSLIENNRPGAAALSASLLPHCGKAHVVGITGAPGAGKSTLINALLGELIRRGRRIAVVAVDPSSPVSGGAILGDRVRMGEHGAHDNVFIRSVSARGHLGGLSRTTGRIVDVFDAAGFDCVIVETVGAGQSEVEISRFADTNIVVCPPGLGDDVQAIKAGILEIADILVVNKGDLPMAERTMADLETMLHLRRRAAWAVAVLRTVATTGAGIAALADKIDEHGVVAGLGRRLKTGAQAAPLVTDDVAAVDRAIDGLRDTKRFLRRPVAPGIVAAIAAVAAHALKGTSVRAYALSGVPLQALNAATSGAFCDAPAGLLITAADKIGSSARREYERFVHGVRLAARARGLDSGIVDRNAKFDGTVAEYLQLGAQECVLDALTLGYADPDAPENASPPGRADAVALRLLGFET